MKKYIGILIGLFILLGFGGKVTAFVGYTGDTLTYDISSLKFELPQGWRVISDGYNEYSFVDNKGERRGRITSIEYKESFEFMDIMPNHSAIIEEEFLAAPLGKVQLVTLDVDNGTAASGITGTHLEYYAVVAVNNEDIYIINFTRNDKREETKNEFIQLLKGMR